MSKVPNFRLAFISGVVASTFVLVSCASTDTSVSDAPGSAEVGGMQIDASPAELSFLADVVVIGTARDVTTQPFTANPSIPAAAQNEIGYEDGSFAKSTVAIEETLKGVARDDVSVAWLNALPAADGSVAIIEGADSVRLEEGQRYVLFLSRGTRLWTGHHIPLGVQGVGIIEGSKVRFLSGERLSLDVVVSGARTPTAPPTETAPPGK
jgi:hypothetical protein